MDSITLTAQDENGIPLEAIFLPEQGMKLISYKKGAIEVIDQGNGPLIGPHFGERPTHFFSKNGENKDPFPHGIARYAAWKAQAEDHSLVATLSGDDMHEGIPLAKLEGQNFKMLFSARLSPKGLKIHLSVVSDTDSIVGIHYYYALPNGKGRIVSQIQDTYIEKGQKRALPEEWQIDNQKRLSLELNQDADYTFFPYPNPLSGEITLETETYKLITRTHSQSQENSWQLWHPKGAHFVCIEPLSAQDPHHPNLTVSGIGIDLEIVI